MVVKEKKIKKILNNQFEDLLNLETSEKFLNYVCCNMILYLAFLFYSGIDFMYVFTNVA